MEILASNKSEQDTVRISNFMVLFYTRILFTNGQTKFINNIQVKSSSKFKKGNPIGTTYTILLSRVFNTILEP